MLRKRYELKMPASLGCIERWFIPIALHVQVRHGAGADLLPPRGYPQLHGPQAGRGGGVAAAGIAVTA